jgi:DUF1365 family protein
VTASCIYSGAVRHRRFAPRSHEFRYSLFMMYLDLEELPDLFKGRWLWSADRTAPARYRRSDYLGDPAVPLDEAVRDEAERLTGRRPTGPIRLLTHLRYWGYCFNPVSFYFCFDGAGERVESVLAEITNTPWKERHVYALERSGEGPIRGSFEKRFHVSPFMDMEHTYHWNLTEPGRTLAIHMENRKADGRYFDATLTLEREEITAGSLARALLRHPLMTVKVMAGIHWQALRLWLKRVPVFDHPKKRTA